VTSKRGIADTASSSSNPEIARTVHRSVCRRIALLAARAYESARAGEAPCPVHRGILRATRNLTGRTTPVHVEPEPKQVVLAQPEMRELLSTANAIAVGNCACREEEKNCNHPLEVCLSINAEAREKIKEHAWREIALDEAMNLLDETYKHGLVHMAYRRTFYDTEGLREGTISFVCSCCTCCCWPLNGLRQYDYHDAIAESAYVAVYDEAKCIGCGACAARCPFDAFSLPESSGKPSFTKDRCFGCGLCVGTCPSGAIVFTPRAAGRTE
jgi:Pyruvate/2-oxoacid:ferredoxin oxidoreductase delta subunit